jgi:hypothetical protein
VCRIGETSRHQVSLLFIRYFEHGKESLDDSIEVVHVGSIDTCSVCARCVCRNGTDKLGDLSYSSFDADRRVSLNNDLTYPVIGRS